MYVKFLIFPGLIMSWGGRHLHLASLTWANGACCLCSVGAQGNERHRYLAYPDKYQIAILLALLAVVVSCQKAAAVGKILKPSMRSASASELAPALTRCIQMHVHFSSTWLTASQWNR